MTLAFHNGNAKKMEAVKWKIPMLGKTGIRGD